MKFGPVPVGEAAGSVLAHAVTAGDMRLRKARRLSSSDIDQLTAAGVESVIVARLGEGDLGEDEAAAQLAQALNAQGLAIRDAATGRVNIHAAHDGLFLVDREAVEAINRVDPAITLATLPAFTTVTQGQMVATVKIIPFGVAASLVENACTIAGRGRTFCVAPYRTRTVALVQTELPGLKSSVLDKTARVTARRLERFGCTIAGETRGPHDADALARLIRDAAKASGLVIVFGASAVSDADDVIPAAIRAAGGTVLRVGLPVDPGNLLVLGEVDGIHVIGAPGCARSPKENGFDWVLARLMADQPITDDDLAGLGVGGLLTEIPSRPAPRERPQPSRHGVHGVMLAAGRSTRMGGPNKLLAQFAGEPLVRRMAGRILASRATGLVVVTGHQADRVRAALELLLVEIVANEAYATGLASSLRSGIAAVPQTAAGALVVLGDMPLVETADLDRMIAAFAASGGSAIVRATHAGKRGNPVILPRASFAEITELEGDTGARTIMESGHYEVVNVELGSAASLDVDTPDALVAAGGVLAG